MKAIYFYDENKILKSVELIELKSTDVKLKLPENSTLVKPDDGLLDPIKFDGKKWNGATQEEHDEYHKDDPIDNLPNDTQLLKSMVGNLVVDGAKKGQTITQIQTMMGSVVTELAQLKGGN